jgi:hypothetical protein
LYSRVRKVDIWGITPQLDKGTNMSRAHGLHRHRGGLVLSAALIGLAIAAAIIFSSGGAAQSAGTTSAALSEYSVLQGPEAASDALPADATPASTARRIPISASGVGEWITLSGERLCIVINGASDATSGAPGACNDFSRLQKSGDLLLTSGAGGPPVVSGTEPTAEQLRPTYWAGLVPDGVTDIVAHYSDGTMQQIDEVDNGFYLATPTKTVTSFSWAAADGTTHSEGGWQ